MLLGNGAAGGAGGAAGGGTGSGLDLVACASGGFVETFLVSVMPVADALVVVVGRLQYNTLVSNSQPSQQGTLFVKAICPSTTLPNMCDPDLEK
jgi:hypothetical protein